jgi:hypothetical protein
MGTNCAVYLPNFYLFTYEFDFIKHRLKCNTCPVVLHRLSLVCRFVDDLFVPDFPDFLNCMYLNQDSFGSSIYPKTSCELNCTSKGFSCNFLDLAVKFLTIALNQSMQVLKWLECLMFIPISQWLQSLGLSIVNFTDSWDFVVVRSILCFRWSVLLSFWRLKAML